MAATISDVFKRQILRNLYEDLYNIKDSDTNPNGDSDRYYIGIARIEEWDSEANPPSPVPSFSQIHDFQSRLQSIKRVVDASFVVTRYNWSSGTVYTSYDDQYHSNTTIGAGLNIAGPWYVITDTNDVYLCIQQAKTATGTAKVSTVKPTGSLTTPFATADGYVWKFLYNVGAAAAVRYLSSNYMPVKFIDSGSTTSEIQQEGIKNAAIPGQIVGIAVDSGGTGYTSRPTITIHGDAESDASAYVNITAGGQIYEVIMKSDSSQTTYKLGKNYNFASIELSGGGGTGAKLRPIYSQPNGLGYDPRIDLASTALMFNAKLEGADGGDFFTNNDFRQVGLLRNPYDSADSATRTFFTDTTGITLQTLTYSGSVFGTISGDEEVLGVTTGAKAIIDYHDTANKKLYVHQTSLTGFEAFNGSENLQVTTGSGSETRTSTTALTKAEAYRYDNEVLYIDNRIAVLRSTEQTEDIKIVIEL